MVHSKSVREELLRVYKTQGLPVRQLSEQFNVPKSTVQNWLKDLKDHNRLGKKKYPKRSGVLTKTDKRKVTLLVKKFSKEGCRRIALRLHAQGGPMVSYKIIHRDTSIALAGNMESQSKNQW